MDGPRCRFAVDFGASSLIALAQPGIEHNSIDAVLLTHLHGDHAAGVRFLLMDAMLAARRTRPLTIAGPRELRVRMDAIREALFPGSHVMTRRFPVDWIPPRCASRWGTRPSATPATPTGPTRSPAPRKIPITTHAGRVGARRLILTHMSREMRARAADVSEQCAYDGLVVTL